MLETSEKLVEYMDICHDIPVALTPLAVQRHLALMAPEGLYVPKHHLMLHLTHGTFFFGNPSWYPLGATKAQSRFEGRAVELPYMKAPPTEVSDPCTL